MEEEKYMMFLSSVETLSSAEADFLLEYYGSAKAVYEADELQLSSLEGILKKSSLSGLLEKKTLVDPVRDYEHFLSEGIRYVSRNNELFPKRLLNIPSPPIGLFYKGELPSHEMPIIAMVGSRSCSAYGKETSIRLAKELALNRVGVVSGMAMGIDGFAHRGALNGGFKTYAILGCGPDICYPNSNIDIYKRIPLSGAVISEYYPGRQPFSANFPRRNRLISGLSDGVVVVEARKKSGTLITVDFALEQSRDVYVIPGRIDDVLSEGCNKLLRSGAKPVLEVEDIVEDLREKYAVYFPTKKTPDKKSGVYSTLKNKKEKQVYSLLGKKPISPEIISFRCEISLSEVTQILSMFELLGYCRQDETGSYYLSDAV